MGPFNGRNKPFFILLLFENKRYFTEDDASKCQYWQCWQSRFLKKKMALLVKKLWRGENLSKSVFGYFKTKKEVPTAIKHGGGGKAINDFF